MFERICFESDHNRVTTNGGASRLIATTPKDCSSDKSAPNIPAPMKNWPAGPCCPARSFNKSSEEPGCTVSQKSARAYPRVQTAGGAGCATSYIPLPSSFMAIMPSPPSASVLEYVPRKAVAVLSSVRTLSVLEVVPDIYSPMHFATSAREIGSPSRKPDVTRWCQNEGPGPEGAHRW